MNEVMKYINRIIEVTNELKIELPNENKALFNLVMPYWTKDEDYINSRTFSHFSLKHFTVDEEKVAVGISSVAFELFLERFFPCEDKDESHLEFNPKNFLKIRYGDEETSVYVSRCSHHPVYLENKDGEFGYLGVIEELIKLIVDYNINIVDGDFVRYCDLGDSNSDVIMAYKTDKGWCGGSHRAFRHFKVGDTVNIKGSVLTSSGWFEDSSEYQKEKKRIEEIESFADENGIVKIENDEIAKKLAVRLCEATG